MIDRSIQPELKKIEALDIAEPEALKLDNEFRFLYSVQEILIL